MALNPLSTQASIGQRVTDARVLGWSRDPADEDAIDSDKLNQAIQEAAGLILGYCQQRFGETEIESWTTTTAPVQILRISDGLCVGILSSSNFSQNDECQQIYDAAIQDLTDIRDYKLAVYGVDEGYTDIVEVEEPEDDTIEENTYFNS